MNKFMGGQNSYLVDVVNGRVFTPEYYEQRKKIDFNSEDAKKTKVYAKLINKKYFPEVLDDGTIVNFEYYYNIYLEHMRDIKNSPHEEYTTEEETEVELNFEDIERIFQKRKEQKMYEGKHTNPDQMNYTRAESIRSRARDASHTATKQAAARNTQNKEEVPAKKKKNVKMIILNIIIALAISATSIGGYLGVDHVITDIKESNVRTYEAEMLVPQGAKHTPSICERNTWPTEDRQGFWYDNAKIAEEVLMMPDEAIDATMYTIYDEMDIYRSNAYIDNYGRVISGIAKEFAFYDEHGNVKDLSELTDEEARELSEKIAAHPNAYARYAGCSNLEDFLLKNGFVDRDGNPDEQAYVQAARDAINNQYNLIKQANDTYQGINEEPVLQEEDTEGILNIR